MTSYQLAVYVAVPLTALFLIVGLVAFARTDRDPEHGVYASYLAITTTFAIYATLLAASSLGEAITQALIKDPPRDEGTIFAEGTMSSLTLFGGSDGMAAAGYAATVGVLALVVGFHLRRRSELLAGDSTSPTVERVDGAFCAGLCFVVIAFTASAATMAGFAADDFVTAPVTSIDAERDLAMGGSSLRVCCC